MISSFLILHKCTKNHDHRLHCSWDMARDRCNCSFLFWAIFCLFTKPPLLGPTPNSPKKFKMSKKFKKRLELSSFYTSVPKDMIISYTRASAYEKQGCATIARLITKFRNYRRVKSRTPPSKYACGGVRWLFLLEHHSFLPFTMKSTNYN